MTAEITALWQADEVRSRRPRVVDEIRHALWFFETTLLDVAPDVLAEYRERLPGRPPRSASAPGSAATRTAIPRPGRTPSRSGSSARAGWRSRATASRCAQLARAIGVSTRMVPVSDELLRSIEHDEGELAAFALEIGDQNFDEPTAASSASSASASRTCSSATTSPPTTTPTRCSPTSS